MDKILVAGGCGFIGHKVASEFLCSGYNVVIIDNWNHSGLHPSEEIKSKYAERIKLLKKAKMLNESILDFEKIKRIFEEEKPDIVIHLANSPNASFANNQPSFALEQIVEGTLSLLEASISTRVRKFVYISSSMVYGDFQTGCINEEHTTDPKELYGLFKLIAENLVKSYHRMHNLTCTIIRPIAVYGPTGHDTFVITKFIEAAKKGGVIKILGANTKLDFNFVDDVAHGIFMAATMAAGNNETFNLGSGQSTKLTDIADFLTAINPDVHVVVEDADPLYPKRGALDISKAEKLLRYSPKYSVKEGLKLFYDSI